MRPAAEYLDKLFSEHESLLAETRQTLADPLVDAARLLATTIENGGTIFICGNGGSAADAQHFAAELVGRFEVKNRRALPAIALTTDSSALTSIGNDFGFTFVYARQIEALGRSGDVLVGISTSGRSGNVLEAFERAATVGLGCLGLCGHDASAFAAYCSPVLAVPSPKTARIQEMHIMLIHALCELLDKHFSGEINLTR